MSAEFTPPQDPTLIERVHQLAAEARIALGRAAAASLIVIGGGTVAAGVEAAVYPTVAQADTVDNALNAYPDRTDACKPSDVISPPQKATSSSPYVSCRYYDWGVATSSGFNLNSGRGYGYRNCTDWVAWRVNDASANAVNVPKGLGNAKDWYANSPQSEQSSTAKAGEIAVSTSGTFGHVAFVESVSADGKSMVISEYNHDYNGDPNQRSVSLPSSEFTEYIDLGVNLTNSTGSTPPPPPAPNDTLYFIKTQNTGSGTVEVHDAISSGAYQTADLHAATYFNEADGPNGTWQMWHKNLYFIKTQNTAGTIEVHDATAASNYQAADVHSTSPFNEGDAGNGEWQMADINHDGVPDLVFIKERNTISGHVEVFASYGPTYNQINIGEPTAFSPTDATNGHFQIENVDLYYIKTQNTGTNSVELFRAPIGLNYQTIIEATGTLFSMADPNNGEFSVEDMYNGGSPELVYVKTQNTDQGAFSNLMGRQVGLGSESRA